MVKIVNGHLVSDHCFGGDVSLLKATSRRIMSSFTPDHHAHHLDGVMEHALDAMEAKEEREELRKIETTSKRKRRSQEEEEGGEGDDADDASKEGVSSSRSGKSSSSRHSRQRPPSDYSLFEGFDEEAVEGFEEHLSLSAGHAEVTPCVRKKDSSAIPCDVCTL